MINLLNCPIETALKRIGKKWTLNIIRDLTLGKTRFNEILEANPKLTPKVLADRLKELETDGIIAKNVTSVTPLLVEYSLTPESRILRNVLFELAMFTAQTYPQEAFEDPPKSINEFVEIFGQMFGLEAQEIEGNLVKFATPNLPLTKEQMSSD